MKKYINLGIILTGITLTFSAFADVMHQVKPGETLKTISTQYYGNDSHAQEIFRKNNSQIPTTQKLKSGQTLIIPISKKTPLPSSPSVAPVDSSIQRTEEGLPLLIDLSSTEPPDPWCCCIESSPNAQNNDEEEVSDDT